MTIKDIAFYFGLVLGSMLLVGAVYVYVKRLTFGLGGVVLIVFGAFLVGLSIWTSFTVSVKADGSLTAEYKQEVKEDLGAKTADLNGSIEELKLKLNVLSQDIAALKKATPKSDPTPEQIVKREAKEQLFQQNSEYAVLVFHKPNQKDVGARISDALLSAGYRSSFTESSLAEASQQFSANTARVIYTKKGQQKLAAVRELLSKTALNISFIYKDDPIELRKGDIQILMF